MNYEFSDGGRAAAGYKGAVSDCVSRALAICTGLPYERVLADLSDVITPSGVLINSPKFVTYMRALGFVYVNLRGTLVTDLPKDVRYIAHTDNHFTAILNGTVYDTIDTRLEVCKSYYVRGRAFNVCKDGKALNRYALNAGQAVTMLNLYTTNYGGGCYVKANN